MKRKILALVAAILLVTMVFAPALATACSSAKNTRNYAKACAIVSSANQQIYACVAKAQLTPYNDVAWLLKRTDRIIANASKQVTRLGYEVECEYVTYIVDGQQVLIDPLHVVNPIAQG